MCSLNGIFNLKIWQMQHIKNYINGQLIEPVSKTYLDNFNPATGKVYSYIPDSDENDVDLAYAAEKTAFIECSITSK
jgi:aminomuconate-semialdehyde/2-hydroxymuconate-6-semialdehyde dehydrogenase